MTHDEKLSAIRAKIVEANPEIDSQKGEHTFYLRRFCDGCNCQKFEAKALEKCPYLRCREIRLADVLLASPDVEIRLSKPIVLFVDYDKHTDAQWNLRQDSLDSQSPETIDFLFSLLIQ